jgi:hypothetical protein
MNWRRACVKRPAADNRRRYNICQNVCNLSLNEL